MPIENINTLDILGVGKDGKGVDLVIEFFIFNVEESSDEF